MKNNNIKKIDILIATKVFEIVLVSLFLIMMIPMYQKMQGNNTSSLLSAMSNNELIYSDLFIEDNADEIFLMDDNEALKTIVPTKLIVQNDSLTNEKYTLMLKLAKDTTLDYNYLNIAIDNEVKSLNSLDMKEDLEYNYFIISSDEIKGDFKEYLVKVWAREDIKNIELADKIDLSYEIKSSALV